MGKILFVTVLIMAVVSPFVFGWYGVLIMFSLLFSASGIRLEPLSDEELEEMSEDFENRHLII